MSNLSDDLWLLEEQLMSMSGIICDEGRSALIPIDKELKRLIYKAIRRVLVARIRASYQMSIPLPSPPLSDVIDFDASPSESASNVELTSDTNLADTKVLGKRKKS